MSRCKTKPVAFPLVVNVDDREQLPYSFADLKADKSKGGGPLVIQVKPARLETGDYTLSGYARCVAVERKSKNDLFHTISQARERFERELARLNEIDVAAVVVECEWSEVIDAPPVFSRLPPKSIFRSVLAWQQRFRRVHWHFLPGREVAEVTTFRILERFLTELLREQNEGSKKR
jgi:hypothetical protein